jgi:hypothetical protein
MILAAPVEGPAPTLPRKLLDLLCFLKAYFWDSFPDPLLSPITVEEFLVASSAMNSLELGSKAMIVGKSGSDTCSTMWVIVEQWFHLSQSWFSPSSQFLILDE